MEMVMWKKGYASGTCQASVLPITYRTEIDSKEREVASIEWLSTSGQRKLGRTGEEAFMYL
jgi:hypothetical protein